MNSSNNTPVESQSNEHDNEAEASLIDTCIHYLQEISSATNNDLAALIDNLIEKCQSLHHATLKSGATDKTIVKDLKCVMNLLAYPEPKQIIELYKRVRTHQGAVAIRNKVGIPSAASGGALAVGAAIAFFAVPTLPIVATATAAIAGVGLATSGTGVVVDARLKRKTIAECEQNLIDHILTVMLTESKYFDYTCSKLLMIKYDAQIRSENDERDNTIDSAITNLNENSEFDTIVELLKDLETHLINNSSNSDTAKAVNLLINTLDNIKEKMENITHNYTSLSK